MDNKAAELIRRSERLFNSEERRQAEVRWENICKYVLPNQLVNFSSIENPTPGRKTSTGVYTAEATLANRDLAAFIKDLASPTERPNFRFINDILNNDDECVAWLDACSQTLHHFLGESNLDGESSKSYTMFPALGNMVIFQEQKPDLPGGRFGGFMFKSIHIAEIVWLENMFGIVDTVYRKFQLTAKQAIEIFGYDKVSDRIKTAYDSGKGDTYFKFVHGIYPRNIKSVKTPTGIPTKDEMPFESCVAEIESKTLVKEEGYLEFPGYVVRWDTMPGEVTGRGPGHVAEPEIVSLNKFMELSLQAFHDAVRPAWLVGQKNALADLDIRANMLNVVQDIDQIRPLRSGADFAQMDYARKNFVETIQKIFYLDKLSLPPRTETGEMSAYEVSQRLEQANKILGPTAGRLNTEFLAPMLIRSFKMLLRAGEMPPMPEILMQMGVDIKVDFVNQLVRSQKMRDGTAIQGWLQKMAMMSQISPEVLDNINADAAAEILARVDGVPEAVLNSDDTIAKIRQQRAEQQQQAQMLEAGVKTADMQAKLSKGGGIAQ